MRQGRRVECIVSVRAICALSVEFHMQRLGYIRSRSCVFDAGPQQTRYFDWIITPTEISTVIILCGAVLNSSSRW